MTYIPISRQTYGQLPRRSLILCASLVQNPANLGGLCRTAEVFRLAQMTVDHAAVLTQPAFIDLAVSAQYWQPISVWPRADLALQFQAYQAQGYTVVGLQQQEGAVPLPKFQFPARTLLVLGRELTGIPPAMMALVDQEVVIPQDGIIDSLNVQVAAAIAAYTYAQQHPL